MKCSACGKLLEEEETAPAKGHTFVKGVCTECGETDPDYVPGEILLGDANGDGEVNSRDSRAIKQYIVGKLGDTDIDLLCADIDGDGEVTTKDSRAVRKLIVS